MHDLSNLLFLDFEATSLDAHSGPIEVAWCALEGPAIAHLIRPHPDWLDDWDAASARVHGLTPGHLAREGLPAGTVAVLAAHALAGRTVVSDSPAHDGRWLRRLLATNDTTAQRPIEIVDFFNICHQAIEPYVQGMTKSGRGTARGWTRGEVAGRVLVRDAWQDVTYRRGDCPQHRAGPDAELLRDVYKEVRLRAEC